MFGNDSPCTGPAVSPDGKKIAGVADVDTVGRVPAYITADGLTLAVDVHPNTGFAATKKMRALGSGFAPDGSFWWAEGTDTPDQTIVHGPTGTSTINWMPNSTGSGDSGNFLFSPSGGWLWNESQTAGTLQLGGPNGLVAKPPPEYEYYSGSVSSLVPQSDFTVQDGIPHYPDQATIAFLARSPQGSTSMFTVPKAGGSPTKLFDVPASWDLGSMGPVYYGPDTVHSPS